MIASRKNKLKTMRSELAEKMGRAKCVAVVGVTGAVGLEMLKTLEKRDFPVSSIKLLASARSAGKKMKFKGEEITVEELTENSFRVPGL